MKKEYISRDEMIEQTKARVVLGAPRFNTGLEAAIEVATNLTAADVVEVVRCRDCVYWEPASPTRTSGNCNRSFDFSAWATDFCSDGKRKDGGQDDD